jgi:cytochrome c553
MKNVSGRLSTVVGIVGLLALGAGSARAQSFPSEFKNLQVLKGIGAEQLKTTMEGFTQALGVKCTFCHTKDQWERDDNEHKLQARRMIQLVQYMKANKAKYFKDDVSDELLSCGTCHRGMKEPEPFVP